MTDTETVDWETDSQPTDSELEPNSTDDENEAIEWIDDAEEVAEEVAETVADVVKAPFEWLFGKPRSSNED